MMGQSLLEAKSCSEEDFELVKKHIRKFDLDDRALQIGQFLIFTGESGLIGFGRIREYPALSEMCSLGIVESERGKGFGRLMAEALMKKAKKDLYLCCITPSFFEPLGFRVCDNFPKEMQDKLDYCTDSLHVEDDYLIMKFDEKS
ncbi:hypothetical protein CNR22_01475 [Sphingobacteriaceae bacterium]|nr:hypothetical protein CNR22_01475 [Sphingobacteriaceae bacterium]